MGAIPAPSPIGFGLNGNANNVQNAVLNANGVLLSNNGPKNYIQFNNFENGLSAGWTLGTTGGLTSGIPTGTPTFGSGSSGLTLGVTSTNPLSGTTSLQLVNTTTTASNMFASSALPVDIEDQTKILNFKCSVAIASGATNVNQSGTSANSFAWALWDVTNSAWILNTGNFSMTGAGTITGTAQVPATTLSVRVVIYVATAPAGACTLNFDSFFLGPNFPSATGPVITDWVSYVPTFTGFGTPTSVGFVSRRVGDSLEILGSFTAGTTTATEARISLGYSGGNSNVTSDSLKIPNTIQVAGELIYVSAGALASYTLIEPSKQYITFGLQNASNGALTKAQGSTLLGTGGTVSVYAKMPIAGFSSNAIQSSDSLQQVVASSYVNSAASALTSTGVDTLIPFPTVVIDTLGAVAGGIFTAPVTGTYVVSASILFDGGQAWGATNFIALAVRKNGIIYRQLQRTYIATSVSDFFGAIGTAEIPCVAGDTLSISQANNRGGTTTLIANAQWNYFNVFRLSGPAVVQATEGVSFKAFNTAGTSIANTGDNNVPFATTVYDTHLGWNGTQYKCPISGLYSIKGTINYSSQTYGINNQLICSVYKNGALDTYGDIAPVMAIVTLPFGSVIDTTIQCNAGDLIEMRAQNTRSAGATTLNTGAGFNHIEISKGS